MNQLIEDNMKLVYHVIRKRYPTYIGDEDIVQVGMIGLWKAAKNYDPEKCPFASFACSCIINEIRKELTKRSKYPKVLSLDYELENSKGDVVSMIDTIVGDEDVDYVDMDSYLSELSPRDREMAKLSRSGLTYKEIAERFNVSRQTVCTAVRKSKLLWRKHNS